MTYDEFERETARYLGIYDEEIFYRWTWREWDNRIKGASLAVIDQHERNVETAWVAGVSSNPGKNGKFKKPTDFFDGTKARNVTLYGKSYGNKKKADFTNYDKYKEGFANFDWSSKLIIPKKKER